MGIWGTPGAPDKPKGGTDKARANTPGTTTKASPRVLSVGLGHNAPTELPTPSTGKDRQVAPSQDERLPGAVLARATQLLALATRRDERTTVGRRFFSSARTLNWPAARNGDFGIAWPRERLKKIGRPIFAGASAFRGCGLLSNTLLMPRLMFGLRLRRERDCAPTFGSMRNSLSFWSAYGKAISDQSQRCIRSETTRSTSTGGVEMTGKRRTPPRRTAPELLPHMVDELYELSPTDGAEARDSWQNFAKRALERV